MGEPQDGVKESLKKIKEMGFKIQILSCRTNREVSRYGVDRMGQVKKIQQYMEKYGIPYDEILNEHKPIAHIYIDDRGIGHRGDWNDTIEKIKELNSNDSMEDQA